MELIPSRRYDSSIPFNHSSFKKRKKGVSMSNRLKNNDRFAERAKTNWIRLIILVLVPCSLLLTPSCDPEAKWETENVDITIRVECASAGFAVCEFTTSQEAYYLIAIEKIREGYNPMDHQKQFMSMALDSAYAAYLVWRNDLWQKDEFNVAPFASHSLQDRKSVV